MAEKTLIIDCDGVLYPFSDLPLGNFVQAMKQTYREDVKLDGATQQKISEQTIAENKLGIFNYVKAICNHTGYSFETFCQQMISRVDYSNIGRNDTLFKMLAQTAKTHKVTILTNNHIGHLDKVLRKCFDKSVFDMENAGIRCFDITSTEKNGVFYPKQNPQALIMFAARIGEDVKNCVLLDDSERNINSAKSIGMGGVLIDEEHSLQQYLGKLLTTPVRTGKNYEY